LHAEGLSPQKAILFVKYIVSENNHSSHFHKTIYLCAVVKKIITAILAFLYLSVSSGIAMEVHYCMGKKAGVELFGAGNDKCSKCGMAEKKGGCCSDEHKFYKLNDSHKNVSNDINFETPVAVVSNTFPVFSFLLVASPAKNNYNNHSPPLYSKPSACILNCVFRI